MCYWGFAFEEACTGGFRPNKAVDCADAFCAVVRAGVGRHRLVLGGEVDCWDGEKAGLPGYVELKTTRVMDAHAQVRATAERDKLLKWWGAVLRGGRAAHLGRVQGRRRTRAETADAGHAQAAGVRRAGTPGRGDPKTALAFADRVLTELKELFAGGAVAPGARVRLEYEPRRSREEVRVVMDDRIPDFIPAEGAARWRAPPRSAPLAAAPPAAARPAARAREPQQEPRQRRRGQRGRRQRRRGQRGRRRRGRRQRGRGQRGRPRVGTSSSGTRRPRSGAWSSARRTRSSSGYDPARHSLRGASALRTGSGGSGWNETKKESRARESVRGRRRGLPRGARKRGVRGDENALRRHDFENAYDTHRSKPIGRANELEDTVASADAFGGGNTGSTPARLPGVSRETVPEGAGERTNCARRRRRRGFAGSKSRSPRRPPRRGSCTGAWAGPSTRGTSGGDGGAAERSQTPLAAAPPPVRAAPRTRWPPAPAARSTPPSSPRRAAPTTALRRRPACLRRPRDDGGGGAGQQGGAAGAARGAARVFGWPVRGRAQGAARTIRSVTRWSPGRAWATRSGSPPRSWRTRARARPGGDELPDGFTPGDPRLARGRRRDARRRRAAAPAASAGGSPRGGVKKRAPPRARPRIRASGRRRERPRGRRRSRRGVGSSDAKKGSVSRTEPDTGSARHPPDPPPDPVVVASAEEKKSVGLTRIGLVRSQKSEPPARPPLQTR